MLLIICLNMSSALFSGQLHYFDVAMQFGEAENVLETPFYSVFKDPLISEI